MSGIDLDKINSGDVLEKDPFFFSEDYYAWVFEKIQPNGGTTKMISVKSPVPGEMLCYIDGERFCSFFLDKGVQNIPLQLSFKEQLTFYFATDESEEVAVTKLKMKVV